MRWPERRGGHEERILLGARLLVAREESVELNEPADEKSRVGAGKCAHARRELLGEAELRELLDAVVVSELEESLQGLAGPTRARARDAWISISATRPAFSPNAL